MKSFEALKQVPLFASLLTDPDDCPSFILDGEEVQIRDGQRVVDQGDPAAFFIVLKGKLQVLKKTGEGEMLLTTHEPGAFFGEMPLMLDTSFFASGRAEGDALVWKLDAEGFWKMLSACPSVARQIMQTMATRLRNLEAIAQGHERLVSLGTMAAGLTHELNNPAAGTRHAARELREATADLPGLTCELHKQDLSAQQLDFLATEGRRMVDRAGCNIKLSPLDRSDREGEVGDWLSDHDVKNADVLAPTLVAANFNIEWLECVADRVGPKALSAVINWVCGTLNIDGAVKAIDEGTKRISDLVKSVKEYSHMDQSPIGEVDIQVGIESTFNMLGHKLKYIDVKKEIDENLTSIWGYAGELNQVWTNLLDNASDAVAGMEKPQIKVRARSYGDGVVVEIEDNGPGITPEVQKRLFEPFYTTKGVGKGTGLGLATSYRIVHGSHRGDISVKSEPGNTRFRVFLPNKAALAT